MLVPLGFQSVFFFGSLGFFCFSLCPPKSAVESFWTPNVENSVFSLQWLKAAKKFGGELCKAEPQCLRLVDAVLSALQHYRKNDVNDVGEWMGWEGWQQQQGLCQSAESCSSVCLSPCTALRCKSKICKWFHLVHLYIGCGQKIKLQTSDTILYTV